MQHQPSGQTARVRYLHNVPRHIRDLAQRPAEDLERCGGEANVVVRRAGVIVYDLCRHFSALVGNGQVVLADWVVIRVIRRARVAVEHIPRDNRDVLVRTVRESACAGARDKVEQISGAIDLAKSCMATLL